MFTISEIREAHAKVRSGTDFPGYIQNLKKLGIHYYEHFVENGRTCYQGQSGEYLETGAVYPQIEISITGSVEALKVALAIHQKGETDYLTFCNHAAGAGVEKWTVDVYKLTCTYFDLKGEPLLTELIADADQ